MIQINRWDEAYKSGRPENTPWEKGEADKYLKRLIEENKIIGEKVLDTCSGLGTQSIYLAQHGFEVWGIEISPTAIQEAKKRAKEADVNIDFRHGTVQALPFADNTFDFIFDRGCLHHQYDAEMEKYLSEINRVLRPGGRLFLIAFTRRFTSEEIKSLFSKDFDILEHEVFSETAADNHVREFHALFIEKK